MAANAVQSQMVAENMTVDNAKKAWGAAVWADKKCDEYGIDKKAVAVKVGSAAWAGLKSIDYSKLASNVASAASAAASSVNNNPK